SARPLLPAPRGAGPPLARGGRRRARGALLRTGADAPDLSAGASLPRAPARALPAPRHHLKATPATSRSSGSRDPRSTGRKAESAGSHIARIVEWPPAGGCPPRAATA